jgi:hypothetical protein
LLGLIWWVQAMALKIEDAVVGLVEAGLDREVMYLLDENIK